MHPPIPLLPYCHEQHHLLLPRLSNEHLLVGTRYLYRFQGKHESRSEAGPGKRIEILAGEEKETVDARDNYGWEAVREGTELYNRDLSVHLGVSFPLDIP